MLTQAAHSADGNKPFNPQALERPDIGAHRNLSGGYAVSSPMARQKSHRRPLYLANRYNIAGVSKRRLHSNLFNIRHPLHTIETASTDHTNPRLWHKTLLILSPDPDIMQFPHLQNRAIAHRHHKIDIFHTLP